MKSRTGKMRNEIADRKNANGTKTRKMHKTKRKNEKKHLLPADEGRREKQQRLYLFPEFSACLLYVRRALCLLFAP